VLDGETLTRGPLSPLCVKKIILPTGNSNALFHELANVARFDGRQALVTINAPARERAVRACVLKMFFRRPDELIHVNEVQAPDG